MCSIIMNVTHVCHIKIDFLFAPTLAITLNWSGLPSKHLEYEHTKSVRNDVV